MDDQPSTLLAGADRAAREQSVFELVSLEWDTPRSEILERVTDALHRLFATFTGVYLYLLEGETLVLRHHRGRPTEHMRIPVGAGICGRAARLKQTVIVDDVTTDGDYIACSLQTRSEIVVPILRGDQVLGEIDIDSDLPAAFDEQDRAFLERLAARLQSKF
jgi:GAF domain-containing protein